MAVKRMIVEQLFGLNEFQGMTSGPIYGQTEKCEAPMRPSLAPTHAQRVYTQKRKEIPASRSPIQGLAPFLCEHNQEILTTIDGGHAIV